MHAMQVGPPFIVPSIFLIVEVVFAHRRKKKVLTVGLRVSCFCVLIAVPEV